MPTKPPSALGSRRDHRIAHDRRRAVEQPWRAWYGTSEWQQLRGAQLAIEPLCRMCAALGIVTPATVCDHVTRHGGDPAAFWGGPFQSLCKHHHDATKQSEERGLGGASNSR